MKLLQHHIGLIIAAVFLLVGLFTIGDYGLTFDEPSNFAVGHYYLGQLLGEENPEKYLELAPWTQYLERYPPVAIVIAAASKKIFTDGLGLLSSIDAWHLPILVFGAITVFLTYWLGREAYGEFAGAIAALGLALYPHFIAHSHYNIKDVPETAFFVVSLAAGYLSWQKRSTRWFIMAAIMAGLALGVKPNAAFLPFIFSSWWLLLTKNWQDALRKFAFFVTIMGATLVVVWPYLWADPIFRLAKVGFYFLSIGYNAPVFFLGKVFRAGADLPFYYGGLFLLLVTPIPMLLLGGAGFLKSLAGGVRQKASQIDLLLLIWLVITIVRISLPARPLYDGIRHFLEVVPVMAIFAGGAVAFLLSRIKKEKRPVASVLLFLLVLWPSTAILRLHPYEGVYFNELVGGVTGASKNFETEYWGSPYREAFSWIEKNLEEGAVVFVTFAGHLGKFYRNESLVVDSNDQEEFKDAPGPKYVLVLTKVVEYGPPDSLANFALAQLPLVYQVTADGVPIVKLFGEKGG